MSAALFQNASTFLVTECLSSSSKIFYFQGTNKRFAFVFIYYTLGK
nr:MAG TPA: hypothetical protein [Caudoviricetes sp.]